MLFLLPGSVFLTLKLLFTLQGLAHVTLASGSHPGLEQPSHGPISSSMGMLILLDCHSGPEASEVPQPGTLSRRREAPGSRSTGTSFRSVFFPV